MKVKFTQSVSTAEKTYNYGEEVELNQDLAKSFIDANFAEEVVPKKKEAKVEEPVEEIKKPARKPRKVSDK